MATELKDLLRIAPGLDRAVEAEYDGLVIRMQGGFDGESAAAVTVLAENYLSELGDMLGFGSVSAWATSGESSCIYVAHGARSFVAVMGPANRSPGRVLERLASSWN